MRLPAKLPIAKPNLNLGIGFCLLAGAISSCSVQKNKDSELKINNGQKIESVAAIPKLLSEGPTGELKSCSSVIVDYKGKIFLATALHCVAEKGVAEKGVAEKNKNEQVSLRNLSLNLGTNNFINNDETVFELSSEKKICYNKRFFQLQRDGSLNQAAPYDLALLPLSNEFIETNAITPFEMTSFHDGQSPASIYQATRFNPLPTEAHNISFQAEGVVAGWGQLSLGAHTENEFSANFALAFERSKSGLIKAYSKYLPGDSGAPFLVSQQRPISEKLERNQQNLSNNIYGARVLGIAISYGQKSRQNFLIDLGSPTSKALFEAAANSSENPALSCEIDEYTKYEVDTNVVIMDEDLIGEANISETESAPEDFKKLNIERFDFSDNSCIVTQFNKVHENDAKTSWRVIPKHCLTQARQTAQKFCSQLQKKCENEDIFEKNELVFIKMQEVDPELPNAIVNLTAGLQINLIKIDKDSKKMSQFAQLAPLTNNDLDCVLAHIDGFINLATCKQTNEQSEQVLLHPFETIPADSGSPLIVFDQDSEQVTGILCIHQRENDQGFNECTLLGPSINSLN